MVCVYGGHLERCEKLLTLRSPGGRVRRSATRTRACLKIHSCNLHAPLCRKSAPKSVSVARYAS
ncbi:MAG: DUF6783 domain-containing protein [Lacrimispora saccharolytica]